VPEHMFRESQRYSWPRVTLIAALFATVLFVVFAFAPALDTPELTIPGVLLIICAVAAVLVTARTQLVTEVQGALLRVQLRPFQRRPRVVPLSTVLSAVASTRQPYREYRGIGIRGPAKNRAYLLRGHRGVLLTLRDGRTLFIGSQQPEALAEAITANLEALPI